MSNEEGQSAEPKPESGVEVEVKEEVSDVVGNRSNEDYARALVDASTEAKKYRVNLKDNKEKLAVAMKKIGEMESAKLKDQGQWKELAEMRGTELTEAKTQLELANTRFCGQVISSQIQSEAAKMGCIDLEALTSLAPVGDLAESVDDNYNVKPQAIKDLLEGVQKKRPYLFQKDAPVVKDGVPRTPDTGTNLEGKSMTDLARALAMATQRK